MKPKPNCYKCKWRRDIPGSAHSRCVHPSLTRTIENPLAEALAVLASARRIPPVSSLDTMKEFPLNIRVNPNAIKHGWFNFPWNFDPIWLENCDGFEPIEKGD